MATSTSTFGVESKVFTLSPDPVPEIILRPEAEVIRCKSWFAPASCDFGGLKALRQFSIASRWADIVHYHFPWPFADILHLTNQSQRPAIMTYHSDIVRQQRLGNAYKPLMKWMLGQMQAIVATSQAYAQTSHVLSEAATSRRVRIIPLGIVEETYPDRGDNSILSALGLGTQPFFLSLGVLRYYKGLHTLVAAANQVNAKIVIAGSGPEGKPIRDEVQKLCLKNVIFAGQVTELEKVSLIKHCQALVLPSHLRSEAYGVVLVEASMYGKPMISCEIGTGTSFVNKHGSTGIVVKPDAPAELAESMNFLLRHPNLCYKYGQAARQRYVALFSGQAMGKSYAQLYEEVAKTSRV